GDVPSALFAHTSAVCLSPPCPHYLIPIPVSSMLSHLSLHAALPTYGGVTLDQRRQRILPGIRLGLRDEGVAVQQLAARGLCLAGDRKSTRLNSSHVKIAYAVLCLKKKT